MADADNADGLAEHIVADEIKTIDMRFAPQCTVDLGDALGQAQHHAEHMFGHRLPVPADLVHHQDAGSGAGVDIDRVEACTVGRHDQQFRRPPQQVRTGEISRCDVIAGGDDLIGMRLRQDRPGERFISVGIEPVEAKIGPLGEHLRIARMSQIANIDHAFGGDDHERSSCSSYSWLPAVAADPTFIAGPDRGNQAASAARYRRAA